jgi:hypothetical protein
LLRLLLRLQIDDRWHTWIDFDRFHELIRAYYASDGAATFTSMDYVAPTPDVRRLCLFALPVCAW